MDVCWVHFPVNASPSGHVCRPQAKPLLPATGHFHTIRLRNPHQYHSEIFAMTRARQSTIAFLCLCISFPCSQAFSQATIEKAAPEKQVAEVQAEKERPRHELFARIRRDAKKRPIALETSVTRYIGENSKGERVSVDLIGVVHIGEKEYYEDFNEHFKKYEAVLYELVAPEGTVIPRGGREMEGMNPLAFLQKSMQTTLGLEFQLDLIDYTVDNFVHADMTPEEFLESMEENGESFMKVALRAMSQSMSAGTGGTSDLELVLALFSSKREIKLRKIMAEQMQNMESGMMIFEGKNGSTIIDHRNKKALDILKSEIESGKTNLAVFYGAGHLGDMDIRLRNEHQMRRGGQTWQVAWKLR